MENTKQNAFNAGWDVVADAVAFIVGHSTPVHRAAVDAMKGFPDAVERFNLHLENEPDTIRDALVARLHGTDPQGRALSQG